MEPREVRTRAYVLDYTLDWQLLFCHGAVAPRPVEHPDAWRAYYQKLPKLRNAFASHLGAFGEP
jgi:hypothetical protein